jgi:selenocysteine lyase/cysteine desulfurase
VEPWLYLDTARLGQMSPAAQRAQEDFARLAGEVGGAIQFEGFLRNGFDACDSALQHRLPGLATWEGIGRLKKALRRLAGLESDQPLLLAARSAELMKFAAVLLCRPCRNILVTDLGWPPYHRILESECRRARRRMTTVSLANDVLHGHLNANDVVDRISEMFAAHDCDGLFLTAVNNLGARLPVERIALALDKRCRFIVVDAAQDFCHVGVDAPPGCCDLYLAGCHKWLGGYHPLGIALYGRSRSRTTIDSVLEEMLCHWQLDDPLLRFVESLQDERNCDPSETVNLASLFSCAGAVRDAECNGGAAGRLEVRISNADRVSKLASAAGWRPCLPDESLRSGILLLEPTTARAQSLAPDEARAALQKQGVVLTAYDGGVLRLSMPTTPLQSEDLAVLSSALTAIA